MAKKSNLKRYLAISAFLLAIAGLAQAATITVDPGAGYDFDTIQVGIDATNGADTVLVAPGEYFITMPITMGKQTDSKRIRIVRVRIRTELFCPEGRKDGVK